MNGGQSTRTVVTTVRVWAGVSERWRSAPGGTSCAVLNAARMALESPAYRAPLPAPDDAATAALNAAGQGLNGALRLRHARGAEAGAIAAAATAVATAATALMRQPIAVAPVCYCTGALDGMVKITMPAPFHMAMREAAALHRMPLSAWLRDAIAATLGEHQVRVPASASVDAWTALRRCVALIAQAEQTAATSDEEAAVVRAGDALAAASERMRACGRFSGRHTAQRGGRG